MSDPRYSDHRLAEPPLGEETRLQRVDELETSSNAMWGWIAGGAVLALLLVFVFARGPDGSSTADSGVAPDRPAATTSVTPPSPAETTGQGAPRPPVQSPPPSAQ